MECQLDYSGSVLRPVVGPDNGSSFPQKKKTFLNWDNINFYIRTHHFRIILKIIYELLLGWRKSPTLRNLVWCSFVKIKGNGYKPTH